MPRGSQHYSPSYGHEAAPNAGYTPYMIYPHQQLHYPFPQANMAMPGAPHMIYPGAMKYPTEGCYPQVPPVPPRKKKSSTTDQKSPMSGDMLDSPDGESGSLHELLRPLPPPLEPEKLPSAKVAAVKYATRNDGNDTIDFMYNFKVNLDKHNI